MLIERNESMKGLTMWSLTVSYFPVFIIACFITQNSKQIRVNNDDKHTVDHG